MNLKNYLGTFVFIFLGMIETSCFAKDYYGRLRGIENKSPYTVTIQSSERRSSEDILKRKNGSNVGQNEEVNLMDIQEMNLRVPWNGWDGDATIHVRVRDNSGKLIDQVDITDRSGHIWGHNPIRGTDLFHVDKFRCVKRDRLVQSLCYEYAPIIDSDLSFDLVVENNGDITIKKP